MENCVASCRTCNERKDDFYLNQYREMMGGAEVLFYGEKLAQRKRTH